MFNGIIEATGKILSIENSSGKAKRFVIDAGAMAKRLKSGDSLAVDGVCLTITERNSRKVTVDISPETLKRTNLSSRTEGSRVNLEMPITASTYISGHFVQGHVEGLGRAIQLKRKGSDVRLSVELPKDLILYCVPKGSITLNGVSLTIAEMSKKAVEIALIPYTLQHTNLGELREGDPVNVETDMIGRYVVSVVKNTYDRERFRKQIYHKGTKDTK
jgi:riboflavin synthase